MTGVRVLLAAAAAGCLVVSCGGDQRIASDLDSDTFGESAAEAPVAPPTAGDVAAPVVARPSPASATRSVELSQAHVWPAPDVVFETPEEAAADFVANVVSQAPEVTLGEYQGADSLSGEIEVLYSGEPGSGEGAGVRSLVTVRKLFPTLGWYVTVAVSEAAVTAPSCCPASSVAPGPLTVEGIAQGHESTVVVSAFPAGDADSVIDQVITSGGLFEPAPFSATLDLSSALPGSTAILVRTDAALTNDPGYVTVFPVPVVLPETR